MVLKTPESAALPPSPEAKNSRRCRRSGELVKARGCAPLLAGLLATVLALMLAAGPAPLLAAPPAPSLLRAAALSEDRVRLRWQDNACDETAFILQILLDGVWRDIPYALGPDTSAVILSGLKPSTTYFFRLAAANGDGLSSPSAATSVKTFHAEARCQVTADQLCLMNGRFAVTASFENRPFSGTRFPARAVPDGMDNGAFWFFDAQNLEISVEMTDGSALNGHVWVNVSGLSSLEYRVKVLDTLTGQQRVYVHPTEHMCGISDRFAFATPLKQTRTEVHQIEAGLSHWPVPEADSFRPGWRPSKLSCVSRSSTELRLSGGRFDLQLQWRDDEGVIRAATPRYDSDNSGFFITGEPDLADWAVKVLDGRSFNRHYWLFWTPLSGRESWLRVTDTETGEERRMYSRRGNACGRADTAAFEAAPDPGFGTPLLRPE